MPEKKPTIACLVTAHGSHAIADGIIQHLTEQVTQPDAVYLAMSDVRSLYVRSVPFDLHLSLWENEHDYGYNKRRQVLPTITEDYVAFMCHDDTYSRDYITDVRSEIDEGADVVWCPWNEMPDCTFNGCSSTLGNFVVRTELAKAIGFPSGGRGYEDGLADARMIDMLAGTFGLNIVKLPRVMYFHNVPRLPIKVSRWGVQETATDYYREDQ
jgi:hypothetical protein